MTTEFPDNPSEQKDTRPANVPAGKSPEELDESLAEINAAKSSAKTPVEAVSDEQNGRDAAESEVEANSGTENWPEETAEAEESSREGEAATTSAVVDEPATTESVAEKLKNKLQRKSLGAELKKLKADLEKAVSDNEALRDKYLRLAAEFDNYRKRIDRDFNQRVQASTADLITELLPVLDDLERSLGTKIDQQNYESLQNGVRLIQQKFAKVLAERGVEPIQAVGAEFDPNLHDALTEMAVEGKPPGVVLEEHTKGYTFRDRVLRPARVIVSK